MAEKVRAALTHAQNTQLQELDVPFAKNDVNEVMTTLQNFVDQYEPYFEEGSLNIFALEAYPNRRTKTAQTAFALVNLTGKTITELKANLQLKVSDFNVNFAPIEWEIDSDFLGNWANDIAIMIVDEVPMEGMATKPSYNLNDLELEVSDVTVMEY
ncbi:MULTISPECIES: hypothetical protein [Aerococcus]|uniref:Uncharacterized protein n=1 Tax=Aerococcus sanguinicola TaxID=119206 RepID=A0A5N1GIF2_9LACT|nr:MULTISPECIES: hypothetical protein [Aerococcus]KAA9300542.1 hypothetical protein F6I03_06970 [Aerococcus sanguinicola]MDK6370154.1 hypothetical protein [Aerococcus sp. UMB9870]MDK6680278.1 hypothetical protein [Aerococcus sp. UMB8608]MDK6686858.1 hypothetical protein [Aerococcus sp. UMB8623]MDK6939969.1 hypothetical protein [Aerococcus sp. UMB8487]